MTDTATNAAPSLNRVLSLPWLVFYGVGVTVGAGIFALIAEIVAASGDHASWAFLAAGIVALFTAFSYAALSGAFPRAAGEALYVKEGVGHWAGLVTGYALIVTAITSSAVIAIAFAGYVTSFTGLPEIVTLAAVIAALAGIAIAGVRETVGFAALITVLEVGTLLVVAVAGLPAAIDSGRFWQVLAPPLEFSGWTGVTAGAFLAFFAYIGFENIVNMAEETRDANKVMPRAVILTLFISVALYVLVAAVAAAYPDRQGLTESKAPLAALFEGTTGYSGATVAAMASIAMVNGILVQVVMASRILYGMANEGMAPAIFATVLSSRKTPIYGIAVASAAVLALAATLPLVDLAEATSFVTLAVFALVNASLYFIGRRRDADRRLARWRYWGLAGTAVSLALIVAELAA
jgi:amino acid transporter